MFPCYYPNGGVNDLKGTFETEKEAMAYLYEDCPEENDARIHLYENSNIVLLDTKTGERKTIKNYGKLINRT